MGSFVPNTPSQQEEMLQKLGCASWKDLYRDVPREVLLEDGPELPPGMGEQQALARMEELAEKNKVFPHIFRGAGAYAHYIPAIVGRVVKKESFLTAYTPYQAEISQGVLQAIFEYQTMICELTGMEVSNASVYDGATAAAEAAAMCADRRRSRVLLSEGLPPQVIETVRTYCFGSGLPVETVPLAEGVTDNEALQKALGPDVACFVMAQPNYYGQIEPAEELGRLTHEAGAKYVMSCNPISLGLMPTPAQCGADVAVGEGQPLGMPLSWGGPYLGYMAATGAMMRKLPGRIVGETKDSKGERAFVLTLQAREQHIRREKAGSNICSNEALCALTASVYLAAQGPEGLRQTALQCCSKAHYLQKVLEEAGLQPVYEGEFFHEFLTRAPRRQALLKRLEEEGYLGGLPVGEDMLLWCATEKNTKAEMDRLAQLVKEVLA
ncbi:aminomethyl-transferring glycine dehydrogenase subunit GcvPA [Fournierella massiliensis]|nr:aminomethyl-transferring glycine dehydrogenase subunit GcvPA [Fournierella massiliensis]MCF2557627.1 aminomethyl-transferring glycine dehydrogenase subunit GcvPA [Fournierella massiliensis]